VSNDAPCSHVVPPCNRSVSIGDQVEAAFRLLDVIPWEVRSDMAKLIYLYMHDPGGYHTKRRDLFFPMSPPGPPLPPPTGPTEPAPRSP